MAVVNLKEILKDAEEKKYAVGCFNVVNYDSVKGILLAAEKMRSPVILGIAEVQLKDVCFESIMNILKFECKKVSVPVAIHLDHGLHRDIIEKAISLGCSSVMYDGSTLPLEENIRETKKIIELARSKGVSVEAEVGEMTTGEKGSQKLEQNAIPLTYTDVNKAKKFVEQTDIDALAVSFGTVHGILPTKPALDLHLLNELNKQISVPLVMHGGSGLDSSDYEQVIDCGIRKINYFSYGYQSVAKKVTSYIQKNNVLYDEISYFTIKTFTEVFSEIMVQFKSAGKV